jgi:hypothetical protein
MENQQYPILSRSENRDKTDAGLGSNAAKAPRLSSRKTAINNKTLDYEDIFTTN